MTLKTPDLFCKGQLFVGEPLVPPIGFGIDLTALKGAVYATGPMLIGDPKMFPSGPGIPLANVMIT